MYLYSVCGLVLKFEVKSRFGAGFGYHGSEVIQNNRSIWKTCLCPCFVLLFSISHSDSLLSFQIAFPKVTMLCLAVYCSVILVLVLLKREHFTTPGGIAGCVFAGKAVQNFVAP